VGDSRRDEVCAPNYFSEKRMFFGRESPNDVTGLTRIERFPGNGGPIHPMMPPTRFERTKENTGFPADSEKSAAQSHAFSAKNPEIGPDLARLIEAWSALPAHIRKAILALVETSK
jgi:hypothetical protein